MKLVEEMAEIDWKIILQKDTPINYQGDRSRGQPVQGAYYQAEFLPNPVLTRNHTSGS